MKCLLLIYRNAIKWPISYDFVLVLFYIFIKPHSVALSAKVRNHHGWEIGGSASSAVCAADVRDRHWAPSSASPRPALLPIHFLPLCFLNSPPCSFIWALASLKGTGEVTQRLNELLLGEVIVQHVPPVR